MAEKRADTILNLMLFIELCTLNRAWNGLTDDEMHWEPHAGAWGVRRRSECTTPTPMGPGEWVIDFAADLERPNVEYYGPSNGMQFTIAALNEISHHGTQICMLRDLYQARRTFA